MKQPRLGPDATGDEAAAVSLREGCDGGGGGGGVGGEPANPGCVEKADSKGMNAETWRCEVPLLLAGDATASAALVGDPSNEEAAAAAHAAAAIAAVLRGDIHGDLTSVVFASCDFYL